MDILHAGQMPWGASLAAHRQGPVQHKRLFEGIENTPDNYALALANESGEYFSPRHRHAWDQVRYCLEGSVPLGRGLRIGAGEVAYFPEGVPYGPQQGGPDRLVLVLQFGGASGQGYMSAEQTRRGHSELLELGVFEQGIYQRHKGPGRVRQDAYEAIWEHVFGKPLAYAPTLYRTPIVLRAEHFPWHADRAAEGVARKPLASFPARGLSLEFLRVEAGSELLLPSADTLRLIFVCRGAGLCDAQDYVAQSVVRMQAAQHAHWRASAPTMLFVIEIAPV